MAGNRAASITTASVTRSNSSTDNGRKANCNVDTHGNTYRDS